MTVTDSLEGLAAFKVVMVCLGQGKGIVCVELFLPASIGVIGFSPCGLMAGVDRFAAPSVVIETNLLLGIQVFGLFVLLEQVLILGRHLIDSCILWPIPLVSKGAMLRLD